MKAVVDSMQGEYFRCLLENGDVLSVYKSYLSDEIKVGDVLDIAFTKDQEASAKQQELIR